MAHPDDYSDDYPPWGRRKRVVPLRTYSGKVVYVRPVHHWSETDLARIMAKINPPDDAKPGWYGKVIRVLRDATVAMLQRLLPFMAPSEVEEVYEFVYDIVDRWLQEVGLTDDKVKIWTKGLAEHLAELGGWTITLER